MKKYICISMLVTGLVQAAASQDIIIARKPATVANSMIDEGVAKTSPGALMSPIGQLYEALNNNPAGINSLGQDPLVVAKTNSYNSSIQTNETLQKLSIGIVELVEAKKPTVERAIALALFGAKYGRLLKKLVGADIPGLKLRPTIKGTIEKNTEVILSADQTVSFKAAQLALGGLNLQDQWKMDPTTFSTMFARYLPTRN